MTRTAPNTALKTNYFQQSITTRTTINPIRGNHIDCAIVCMLASSVVDCGYKPWSKPKTVKLVFVASLLRERAKTVGSESG